MQAKQAAAPPPSPKFVGSFRVFKTLLGAEIAATGPPRSPAEPVPSRWGTSSRSSPRAPEGAAAQRRASPGPSGSPLRLRPASLTWKIPINRRSAARPSPLQRREWSWSWSWSRARGGEPRPRAAERETKAKAGGGRHHGGGAAAGAALPRARRRREADAEAPELLPVREAVGGRRMRGAAGSRARHLLGAVPAGARYGLRGEGLGRAGRPAARRAPAAGSEGMRGRLSPRCPGWGGEGAVRTQGPQPCEGAANGRPGHHLAALRSGRAGNGQVVSVAACSHQFFR